MHVIRPIPLRRRLTAVVVTALAALTGTAIVAPGVAQAAPTAVTGGHVEWGVKQSFRSYIAGPIAHGSITLASSMSGVAPVNRAPAINVPVRTSSTQTVLGTDVYRFGVLPGGTNDSATRTADIASGGVVRYQGHDGLLDLAIDNIRVDLDGTAGVLIADVTSKALPTEENPAPAPVLFDDVELADLDLTSVTPTTAGGQTTYAAIPATLAEDGAPAFGGFYAAGSPVDPVTLVLRDAQPAPAPVVGRAVDTGSVRWTISRQIWGQASLNQCLVASDGASVAGTPSDASFADPTNGVSFPIADGRYDAATGATELDLDGTVVLGNRSQGNYRIKLADPALTIDAAGNGTLTADVSSSLPPGGAPPANCDLASRTFVAGGQDVVIATFSGTLADGPEVTGAFTPHFAENVYSADPRLTSALDPSLRGHFSVSNGNPNLSGTPAVEASHRKALQPIRVSFVTVAPTATTLDLTPATSTGVTGTQRCVTATVTDELAEPFVGAAVTFTRTGANAGTATVDTGATGTAQHCYTGTVVGTDTITATAGGPSDTATATWTAPPKPNALTTLLNSILALLASLLGG